MAYKLAVVQEFREMIITNRQAFSSKKVFREGGREACITLDLCTYVTHGLLLSLIAGVERFRRCYSTLGIDIWQMSRLSTRELVGSSNNQAFYGGVGVE